MSDRRAFMQWFVMVIGFVLATFFAAYYGILQTVWKTDITYMTSVIAGLTVLVVGYLGLSSWRLGDKWHKYHTSSAVADANLGRIAAYVVTLVGLLGTVIGLQYQASAMATVSADNLSQFLVQVSVGLKTAFYATQCGIVGSLAIIAAVANLDHFIDYNDVEGA